MEAAANSGSAGQAQDATPAESSGEDAGGLLPPTGADGATRHELVVVDPEVPAYEQLIGGLKERGAEGKVFDVVILDPQRNGLGQISEILAARGGLDAVHLISHGGDGGFRLGGDGIDLAVLQQDADAVRAWGNALRADADILIYGCDLASTTQGKLLVDTLARLTGADVAASDDPTGSASLGGDWDLEHQAGVIDARVAVSESDQGNWMATLAAPVANDDPGTFSADVLSLNPVSYWRLGETSGTAVADIGSAGNATGTYNGPSLGENDPINGDPDGAAGFNRTELDYIDIAHDDAYLLNEGTVQLWFNADDLAQEQTLFSKDSSGLDTGGHLTIWVRTDGSVETRLQSASGDNFVYSAVGSVTAGNWHHLAFTFGSGGMQLYLDGNRVDTNPYTGGLGTSSGGAGNYEPIAIGASTRSSGNGTVAPLDDYFNGRIDEVAIFGTALGGADINRLSGGALQHYTLAEDTSLSVAAAEGVLANDFDEDGDPLTAVLVSGPAKAASFALNADGSFNYTPIADFSGTDSFTYRADDSAASSNIATVTITVDPLNDAPSAVADTYTASEEAVLASNTEWFDGNWQFRKTISFDNTLRPENLIDFPVLVALDSSRIDYGDTRDEGQDLRFFDADGTPLAHEIESWYEGGTSYVWVKVPRIDASSATDSIWMYYGNASAPDGQNPAAVWSDYRGVYHLNEDPGAAGTVTDSAGNFDANNGGTADSDGKIGNAQQFNGTSDHIDLGQNRDWINSATSSSLSIWMKADSTSGSDYMLGVSVNGASDTSSSRIAINRSGEDIELIARSMDDGSDVVYATTSSNPLTAGAWHLVTGTVDYASDTNNIKIYVDGALEATFSHDFTNNAVPATNSTNAAIGSNEDLGTPYFEGALDEARIAAKLRSAEWVSAQYASMTDKFATFGYVQTVSGVLGNDVDPDDSDMLMVSAVNGNTADVGSQISLASGALLTVNADGSFTWDPNGAFENLGAGASTTDSFNYTARDGAGATDTTTVTITVNGVDDPSVVSGTFSGGVTEGDVGDAPVTATGTLSISDVDDGDDPSVNDVPGTAGDNGYGSFVLTSGTWTYTLDQSAVQNLDAGDLVNDSITFAATDGRMQQITVTITGTDDLSVISGTATGAVNEGDLGDAPVTATGTISISDVDDDDSPSFNDVASTLGDNGYGSFVLSSGTWTYTLDQSAVQNLDAGDFVSDTITYTATDGSTRQITITITGTDDASVISGTVTGAVNEGNIGDAPVTAVGSIAITDADDDDSPSFGDLGSTVGDNGYGSFVLTSGTWTYTLDQSAVQNLDAGDVVNDTITYTATDGSTQQVSLTITGTDDAPVITGTVIGAVNEGNVGDAPVTATGTISISDVDDDDSPSFNDVGSTIGDNGYGSFVLTAGTWTYTLDQSAVQNLGAGEAVNDTITYTATDGSARQISVTITGTEDAAIIGGTLTPEPPGANSSDAEQEEPTEEPIVAAEAPVSEDAVLQPQTPGSLGGGIPGMDAAMRFNGLARTGDDGATDLPQPIVPDELLLEVVADRDAERGAYSQVDKPDARTAQRLLEGLRSVEKVPPVAALTEVGGHGSRTEVFWHDLEQMGQDMERAAEEDGERLKLSAEAAAGVTLSLTAGVVSWVLRAGSLVASFLTVMPTWRHFDPMPILSAEEPADRGTADDDPEGPDEPAESKKVAEDTQVEAMFDR